jgi:hypothetical protein
MNMRDIINLIESTVPEDGAMLLFLCAEDAEDGVGAGFPFWDQESYAKARYDISDYQTDDAFAAYASFHYKAGEDGSYTFTRATPLGWFGDNSTLDEIAAALDGRTVSVQ